MNRPAFKDILKIGKRFLKGVKDLLLITELKIPS
jgi:hypothetical protein